MASMPLNYAMRPQGPKLVDQSVGFAQWGSVLVSGDGTLQLADSTDPRYLLNGDTKALKVTITPGAVNTRYRLSVPITPSTLRDFQSAALPFYVEEDSGSLGVFGVWLGDAGVANRFTWDVRNAGVGQWSYGANCAILNRTYRIGTSGAPAFGSTTFAEIRLDIQAQTGSGPIVLHVGSIPTNIYTKPQVYLVFDDQGSTIYSEAFTYMATRNMVGSLAIATGLAFGLTTAQIDEMLIGGWSIHNHSHAHTTYTGKTFDFVKNDINTARAYLAARGWDRSTVLVSPGGNIDRTGDRAVLAAGYTHCVNGDALSGYKDQQSTFAGIGNPLRLCRCVNREASSALGLTYFLSRLTDAITTGASLGMLFHSVGGSELNVTDFRTLIDTLARYRAANMIDIVNLDTFVSRFTLPRRRR